MSTEQLPLYRRMPQMLRHWFAFPERIAPGLYHYRWELEDRHLRLHLRVDPNGAGLLMVNASGVLHLNETAVMLIKHVLDGGSREAAVTALRRSYRVTRNEAGRDYDRIREMIRHFETTQDACPIAHLDVADTVPFGRKIAAPYRADLALTYACNNECKHCYVARARDALVPLELGDWKRTLDALWRAGVPHVCFTGGEATLSPHLAGLIEHAEDIGLVTGLLTNGRRLANVEYAHALCVAGLDHVQITLESHDERIHDEMVGCPGAFQETVQGIRNMLAEDIYLLTNTTLCSLNQDKVEQTVAFLKELGVRQFAMNSLIHTGKAPESGLGIEEAALGPILDRVADAADELGLRFIWYTPTHYCKMNPLHHDAGYKRCSAAEYNICIEPDGSVIPCQSYYESVGNILNDSWEDLWNSPLFKKIRNRDNVPSECRSCPDFDVCGAGCPLSTGERFLCMDSPSGG